MPAQTCGLLESGIVQIIEPTIGFGLGEETDVAKARWFLSLPFQQRMDIFCEMTNFALELNPHLPDRKDARSLPGRVRELTCS